MMIKVVKSPNDEPVEFEHPLMDKISSAYTSYRRDLIYKLPELIKNAFDHSEYRDFWYDHPSSHFSGVAKLGSDMMQSMVQMLPVSYMNRAHLSEPISQFVDENCTYDGLTKAGEFARLGGIA